MTAETSGATLRRYYVDTSAWLAGMLGQSGGEAVRHEVQGAELVSSVLLVSEVDRNLVRLARDRLLTAGQLQQARDRFDADLTMFTLADLTLALARERAMPAVTTPRTLDLVHLRTALAFHAERPLTRFVTLDGPQSAAARELGLPV
jgi:predicted nucleic acid-binding protein